MTNPISTYRVQFHKAFSFEDLEKALPYLVSLGVGTIYASPVFESTPGSTHGYDGTNPLLINPEIGTEEQLRDIHERLKKDGLGWLQDIVPNHMAFHPNNAWLMDVLEKGRMSTYAAFFDVAWTGELYHGRIMVPFLGSPLEKVIEEGSLKLRYHQQRLNLAYYDSCYPIHAHSYATVLSVQEHTNESIQQLLDQLHAIKQVEEPNAYSLRFNEFTLQLASLMKEEATRRLLEACIEAVNNDKQILKQLSDEQVYKLCYWQDTDHKINYRRFFTVNGLICLNIQDELVFEHYHRKIKQLVSEGVFSGLRVDHIDGLFDPQKYLEQLRELAGDKAYVIVEKILEPGENLPGNWPIQGNTGYDFLSMVNNLFTSRESEGKFTHFYQLLTGDHRSIHQQLHDKKAYILFNHMAGELENLRLLFFESNLVNTEALASVGQEALRLCIGEFLVQCPVYRYYGNRLPLNQQESADIQDVLDRVKLGKPELAPAASLLEEALLQHPQTETSEYNARALAFYQRCMQFTGPLMAKGVEDTLMYTYTRFIGHNEVGDSPEAFGSSPKDFHQQMAFRQQHWPFSLNGTSTHDTKRGEDVRARLNVLTDLAEEWLNIVSQWQGLNKALKTAAGPDGNDEYLIYQTLAGAYPMRGEEPGNFAERITEYLSKALREAKTHSNWTTPNTEYEQAATQFATNLLDQKRPFWKSFEKFHEKVSDFGIINSLSQVLLKFTCPGVPDMYQGCELWDLSLVDPDNRRPVDYELRSRMLDELKAKATKPGELLGELWGSRCTGQIKLWLTQTLLQLRKQNPEAFTTGMYIPLKTKGAYSQNILAFARRHQQSWYLTVVPLHVAAISAKQKKEPRNIDWKDTLIILPAEAPAEWKNLLDDGSGKQDGSIFVKQIFKQVPFAVLELKQPATDRGSGVLLHITSLPSRFGIGDFGPEAYDFAGFLSRSGQKYWQMLPLSPTEAGQGNSPYSSFSSMAGNSLLISPELLSQEGLLDEEELKSVELPAGSEADFKAALDLKTRLFEKAYRNFLQGNDASLLREFQQFCSLEEYWLADFALYVAIKKQQEGKPWYEWPQNFKNRETKALDAFSQEFADELNRIKWLQFIFSKQWRRLRAYCNTLGIKLFGDLPFYVGHDSADVWSNRDIFSLDEEGNMNGVAGVPPDYFNEDGQLWGMPVFCWDVLKESNYEWWVRRIRKNMELYDLLRLDHFRAFADYWEVPASEKTAINGKWKPGPGAEFFNVLEEQLGNLPFVAEDLGDINEAVYELRDAFELPGMVVLQFAFGDDLPQSLYIPHNHRHNAIAYTGTHDNNTSRGWYRKDADKANRKRLQQYAGRPVSEKNAHEVLGRLAYGSVAKTVIMPLQDVLGLDETARMNTPASAENNWYWRFERGALSAALEQQLLEWVKLYNR